MSQIDDLTEYTLNFVEQYNRKLKANPPEDDEQNEPYCCSDCERATPEHDYDPQHGYGK